jgi:thiosulfate dehydrogenase
MVKPYQKNSREMQAMVAYMHWLSEGVSQEVADKYQGFVPIELPERAVDFVKGKQLYKEKCAVCHGQEGQGQLAADGEGYSYPPLAGEESYNHGAGMHSVTTAAGFIKANMPLGVTYTNPALTDEEAYDIAGYINSLPRPEKEGVKKDFPDLTKKPVDTPYGSYADPFPQEQHQFGPFQPTRAYYDSLKANNPQAAIK